LESPPEAQIVQETRKWTRTGTHKPVVSELMREMEEEEEEDESIDRRHGSRRWEKR